MGGERPPASSAPFRARKLARRSAAELEFGLEQRAGPVREVRKELVFEVAFDSAQPSSRHKSGVALRFPRINRIRWDKPASEAATLTDMQAFIEAT